MKTYKNRNSPKWGKGGRGGEGREGGNGNQQRSLYVNLYFMKKRSLSSDCSLLGCSDNSLLNTGQGEE
jgi:hypothetical protein